VEQVGFDSLGGAILGSGCMGARRFFSGVVEMLNQVQHDKLGFGMT